MIPIILAHGSNADEFAVLLLGIAVITYMAAVWIGNRMNKEPDSAPPPDEQINDHINVE